MTTPGPQSARNNLFNGATFWLSRNVPQRTRLKEMISQSGGNVVLLERDADVKLVDHRKKNLPPDSFSYQYVERSIQNGRLEDLEGHRIGPSAQRPMGASHIPKKSKRTGYSLEEDQILYDYLYPYEQAHNAPISGNFIYKQLAEQFRQHSWQSWRSRYLRFLRGKPRPGGGTPRPELLHRNFQDIFQDNFQDVAVPPQILTQPQAPEQDQIRPVMSGALQAMPAQPTDSVDPNSKRKRVSEPQQSSANRPRQPPNIPHIPQIVNPHSPVIQTSQTAKSSQSAPKSRTKPTADSQDLLDLPFLELPSPPSSSEPDEDEELGEYEPPDVESWIDSQLARGFADESTIITVLHAATLDQELAGNVLEHWDPDKGIPDNMPGIWTVEDDKCIESENARDIQRVLDKHGDAFNSRLEYLSMTRERGML